MDDIVLSCPKQFAGDDLNVLKRKLPKREEAVDFDRAITVNGAEMVDAIKRIGFGSCWQCLYKVEITLITPNDRDQAAGLDDHTLWRESVRANFMRPHSVAGTKRVEIAKSPMFGREELAIGYDYDQVVLIITTYERRQ